MIRERQTHRRREREEKEGRLREWQGERRGKRGESLEEDPHSGREEGGDKQGIGTTNRWRGGREGRRCGRVRLQHTIVHSLLGAAFLSLLTTHLGRQVVSIQRGSLARNKRSDTLATEPSLPLMYVNTNAVCHMKASWLPTLTLQSL